MTKKISETTVQEVLEAMLPHTCMTCGWMIARTEAPKKGQRFCKYPGAIDTRGNQCLMWKLEPDPLKRSTSGSWVDY